MIGRVLPLCVLAALSILGVWSSAPRAHAQSDPAFSGEAVVERRRTPKLVFPPLLKGSITLTQKTTSDPNHTLTITWQGVLKIGEQLNEVKGPFVAGYGLGHGTFSASGGSRSAGDSTYQYFGHYLSPFDTEHLSIYIQGGEGNYQARTGFGTSYWINHYFQGRLMETFFTPTRLLGIPGTATPNVTLKKGGKLNISWQNVQAQSAANVTWTINGSFGGQGTWTIDPDQNPVAFNKDAPTQVTVRALGVPEGKKVKWKGLPPGTTFEDDGQTAKLKYDKPGKYTISATYKGHKETSDVYVVQAKFAGRIKREDPTGEHKDLPKSVPPGKTADEEVEITPDLSDTPYSVELRVWDSDDEFAGSALVEPNQLAKSGQFKVRGGTQTERDHQHKLILQARVSGNICGEGEKEDRFSVCAHPTMIHFRYDGPDEGNTFGGSFHWWGNAYGLNIPSDPSSRPESDSGDPNDLSLVYITEQVRRSGAATGIFGATQPRASDFLRALATNYDHHVIGAPSGSAMLGELSSAFSAARGNSGTDLWIQQFRYGCDRCGIPHDDGAKDASPLVPYSGYRVDYVATKTTVAAKKIGYAHDNAAAGDITNTNWRPAQVKP
jgi:hypothetical protein